MTFLKLIDYRPKFRLLCEKRRHQERHFLFIRDAEVLSTAVSQLFAIGKKQLLAKIGKNREWKLQE